MPSRNQWWMMERWGLGATWAEVGLLGNAAQVSYQVGDSPLEDPASAACAGVTFGLPLVPVGGPARLPSGYHPGAWEAFFRGPPKREEPPESGSSLDRMIGAVIRTSRERHR